MQVLVSVAVYPWVYQYIRQEYGSAEVYDAQDARLRGLVTGLKYFGIQMRAVEPPALVSGSWCLIKFRLLHKYVPGILSTNVAKFEKTKRGAPIKNTFFLMEFWLAAHNYIKGLKAGSGCSTTDALRMFLDMYDITEDIYSFTSALNYYHNHVKGCKEANLDRSNKYKS